MSISTVEKERFRSFAERYVIERAGHWKPGEEDIGAWTAIQDAKRAYHQIALAGDNVQSKIARHAKERALRDLQEETMEYAAKTQGVLQAGNAQSKIARAIEFYQLF